MMTSVGPKATHAGNKALTSMQEMSNAGYLGDGGAGLANKHDNDDNE